MKLLDDWRWIVRRAWSFRLNVLASLFAAAEILLPLWSDDFHRGTFAMLILFTVIGSGVARVVAQRHEQ